MKINRWKIFPFLCVLVLSSCTSCNEPADPTVLQTETQTGENTFGCYVNNEIFVGGFASLMSPTAFNATYSKKYNSIEILVSGILNNNLNTSREIYIEVLNVKSDSILVINRAYCYNINNLYPYYETKNSGEIYLTKLDTINKIVSGSFKFTAKSYDYKHNPIDNDSVVISDGRFDLKMEIAN